MTPKFKPRKRTRAERVLDALRFTHPRYMHVAPKEIRAALKRAR